MDVSSRKSSIERHRSAGRRIAAVFPGRYPAEVLHAAGFLPVEVWDPPGPTARASGHLQPFVCGVGLASLELLLSDKAPALDCLLFPHLCDTLQNLFTIVRDCIHHPTPAFLFYPPRNTGHSGAEAFVVTQARRLAGQVAGLAGRTFSDSDLADAGAAVDRAHAALSRLYAARRNSAGRWSNTEFYRTVRLRELVLPDELVKAAEHLLADAERGAAGPADVKLVLSGVLPDRSLLALLDQRNVHVVEDDLISTGRRLLRKPIEPAPDPWTAAARRLLSLPPCTSIASPIEHRIAWLTELVRSSGAAGVLLHTVKFCELELFDHPFVVQGLRKAGIPVLVLESELHQPQVGQLATRLDAFLEVL
ncbi:MAG: 2-hydroxyacyl-CoA dehydratase [Deltaproteobacteria bacterium]|nr:2-hydroxyacyl-CoA dehydratase [Deltaproteobacteria bacterium]